MRKKLRRYDTPSEKSAGKIVVRCLHLRMFVYKYFSVCQWENKKENTFFSAPLFNVNVCEKCILIMLNMQAQFHHSEMEFSF